jgi:hypothetical protein
MAPSASIDASREKERHMWNIRLRLEAPNVLPRKHLTQRLSFLVVLACSAYLPVGCTDNKPEQEEALQKDDRAGRLVYRVAQLGAYIYQQEDDMAICFGAMGPPMSPYISTHYVPGLDEEFPRLQPWERFKSASDCNEILELLRQIAAEKHVSYIDLACLPVTLAQVEQLDHDLPGVVVRHYEHMMPPNVTVHLDEGGNNGPPETAGTGNQSNGKSD